MLEVGFALRPQVDDDVEKGAAGAAHELGFRGRRKLEMHSAYGALFPILGDAGLGNERVHAALLEFLPAKAAGKETSFVVASLQLDDEGAFELGLGENHGACSLGGLWSAGKVAPVPQVRRENAVGHQALDMSDALIARPFELFEERARPTDRRHRAARRHVARPIAA